MKYSIPTLALAASLLAGAAVAQAPTDPAKGNAPLKPAHTVNDGGARNGANSFSEGQARQHIEKSGFTAVTGLAKGRDGVWRGKASRNGQVTDVAMDFKGNVTTPVTATNTGPATMPTAAPMTSNATASSTSMTTTIAGRHATHRRRHHRRHHHGHSMSRAATSGTCANPGVNGAACSGVDRNQNGISDREDKAIKTGAKP